MYKRTKVIIIAAFIMISTVGCQTTSKVKPVCQLPSGNNLENAIEHAKSDLTKKDCQIRFDDYFMSLMTIGENNPDISHKQSFSSFLSWAHAENIISMNQAKEYYSKYFAKIFVSLPSDYNTCSSFHDKHDFDNLLAEMDRELNHKERGLMKVCGDKSSYQLVYDQYNALLIILEATWLACDRSQ